MTRQTPLMRFLSIGFLVLAAGSPANLGISSGVKDSDGKTDLGPSTYEVTTIRQYTLTARIRLLLLWIRREGVGGGRITWGEGTDGSQVVELLIGSDPERTPMRINRWGYIIERVAGSSAELAGVMTESGEHSIEQAKEAVSRTGISHSFKGIRASLTGDLAQSSTMSLLLADDFTFRDAETLLRQLPQNGALTKQIRVPDGTKPGFLFALKSLLHDSVVNCRKSGHAGAGGEAHCQFVYAASLFDLTQRSSRFLRQVTVNGRTYREVIESEFETRNLTSGESSHFSITYGVQSPIAETPIRIVYRPRWWFEAELLLAGESEAPEGRETAWNLGAH